jgi:hypothetical protein
VAAEALVLIGKGSQLVGTAIDQRRTEARQRGSDPYLALMSRPDRAGQFAEHGVVVQGPDRRARISVQADLCVVGTFVPIGRRLALGKGCGIHDRRWRSTFTAVQSWHGGSGRARQRGENAEHCQEVDRPHDRAPK